MTKFTLYCGLFDKDTKRQEIDSLEAFKIVSNLAADMFGGATIFNANGIYKHDDGSIVIEPTLKIEIFSDDHKSMIDFIGTLKSVLNQESVIMQRDIITSEFI